MIVSLDTHSPGVLRHSATYLENRSPRRNVSKWKKPPLRSPVGSQVFQICFFWIFDKWKKKNLNWMYIHAGSTSVSGARINGCPHWLPVRCTCPTATVPTNHRQNIFVFFFFFKLKLEKKGLCRGMLLSGNKAAAFHEISWIVDENRTRFSA